MQQLHPLYMKLLNRMKNTQYEICEDITWTGHIVEIGKDLRLQGMFEAKYLEMKES